jgi:hypothetical protein
MLEADNNSSPYASQQKVFDDLGRDVLKNAFDGKYNYELNDSRLSVFHRF